MKRRNFFKTLTLIAGAFFTGLPSFGKSKPMSSLDNVNHRNIIDRIKRDLEFTAKDFIFEPNDHITRHNFNTRLDCILAAYVTMNMIENYSIHNDEITNTPKDIDKGIMRGYIYIQPKKCAEFVVLDFALKIISISDHFNLTGFDYVDKPLKGYEINN